MRETRPSTSRRSITLYVPRDHAERLGERVGVGAEDVAPGGGAAADDVERAAVARGR